MPPPPCSSHHLQAVAGGGGIREAISSEGGSAALRPPPGLRGREIGLWFVLHPPAQSLCLHGTLTPLSRYAAQSRKRQQVEGDALPLLSIPSPHIAAAQQALVDFEASALSRAPVHARASEGVGRVAASTGDVHCGRQLLFDEAEECAMQASAAEHARSHAPGLADMSSARARLPVHAHRAAILSSLQLQQVTLVCGETGCGKTTQVPQYILEQAAASRSLSRTRILCTQPRRISATSVAQRVASERLEHLGCSVGFSIRLQQQLPRSRGSVTFCTTGVVLRLLQSRDALADVSHLIIDEVHERDVHTDFLLAAVKRMLPQRPHLKLLLMSATIDADRFARYFGEHVPVVRVPGLTYPVTDLFLEDVMQKCGSSGSSGGSAAPPFLEWRGEAGQRAAAGGEDAQSWGIWLRALAKSHGEAVATAVQRASCATARDIDLKLVLRVIEFICDAGADGAVLVFLPGWADITALHDMLQSSGCTRRHACKLVPLHSQLPMKDQAAVFTRPAQGVRKIIIATGIAGQSRHAVFR